MDFDKDKITKIITEKGATKPCHRCGKNQFSVLEGYSNIMLQNNIGKGLYFGGPTVPVALVACNNCGSVTSHAIGALGLLPEKDEDKTND